MLALYLAAMAWLVEANDDIPSYNVHGSVVFARTGERTPLLAKTSPQVLTPLGAQQMHRLGQNFRTRYIDTRNGPVAGLGRQQIQGLATNRLDNDQLAIQAFDEPWLVASAQAFMQGLYPPYATSNGSFADSSGILANNTAIDFPMGGYQYPNIQVLGASDPDHIFIAGAKTCPMSQQQSMMYFTTDEFADTMQATEDFYGSLDIDWFQGLIEENQLDYINAFEIYDYLSYAYEHDSDVHDKLANGTFNKIGELASEEAWNLWGNTSSDTSDEDYRAMAGKTLAALVLQQFQDIVTNVGNTSNGLSKPLTLLFGDHEPMISLISLLEVDSHNENFRDIPPFASSIVFELFSNGDDDSFPTNPEDLYVNFLYQNGTDFEGQLIYYPMFGNGPSGGQYLRWNEFKNMMSRIRVSSFAEWCGQCNAGSIFCWGVDNSTLVIGVEGSSQKRDKVSPTVAGVIGAVVTLAVAGLLFAVAMLLGGIRFHRVTRGKKSELGGFKGSAKLASDADLNIPKNGALPAGIVSLGTEHAGRKQPHERVGSWELRQKEFGKDTGDVGDESRRASFEAIEAAMSKPVEPTERV